VKNEIGQKNATAIEKALDKYVEKYSDTQKIEVYKKFQNALKSKIEEMEYTLMVSRFTPE
jgi:hypothetical protein